ncbi:MAG: hypothetical protein QE271_00785 [Bacteriovoracaceae bacterium]|nr:hypothetical protein [Bacteriovoracaceae bacterium]
MFDGPEESLAAEYRIFANDVSIFYIEVQSAPAGSAVPYVCVFGQTGIVWAGPQNPPTTLPCTLSSSGDTVLVKDTGAEIRLAIDKTSFISKHPKYLGFDQLRRPDSEVPFAGFGIIREKITNTVVPNSYTNGYKMNGHRLDCSAL